MAPLTAARLETARQRWEAQGSDFYRLVVRVRPPRAKPTVYAVEVARGAVVKIERDGQSVAPEDAEHSDYSVPGLFELLRQDLRWNAVDPVGNVPAIDLRAYFEPGTGRLVRYRRTVGTGRRRVLMVEVLAYEPSPSLHAGAVRLTSSRRGGAWRALPLARLCAWPPG